MVTSKNIDDMLDDVAICLKYMHENYGITIKKFDTTAIKQIGKFLNGPYGYDLDNSYFEEIFFLCLAEINGPIDIKNRVLLVTIDNRELKISHIIRQAQIMKDSEFLCKIYQLACRSQENKVSEVDFYKMRFMHYTIIMFRVYF